MRMLYRTIDVKHPPTPRWPPWIQDERDRGYKKPPPCCSDDVIWSQCLGRSTSSYVSTTPQWFRQNVLFSNWTRQHGSLCSTPWLGWTVMSSLIAPLTNQETSSTDLPEAYFKKDGTCKCLIIIAIISAIIIITTIILPLMSVLVCRDWNVVSAEKCRKCLNF